MMTSYLGLRSHACRLVLVAMAAVIVSGGLVTTAHAATWGNEQEMVDSGSASARATFVADPGQGARWQRANLIAQHSAYYRGRGFGNILTWAPQSLYPAPGNARWAGCGSLGQSVGTCPDGQVAHLREISFALADTHITALEWDGAFIALGCGNFSERLVPGPVPVIRGEKFDDANGNGARDPGEPRMGGWEIQLYQNGGLLASTTTAPDGSYQFALDANALAITGEDFELREVQQPGWRATRTPATVHVPFGSGQAVFGGNDFGNRRLTDLVVHKDASKDVTIAGEDLQWTLTVTNRGLFDTPDVVVDDDIPAAVADTTEIDPACTLAGSHLRCALGTMAPNAVRVLRFRTLLRTDLDRGSSVRNCATAGSSYPDSNPADNTGCDETEVDTRADLVTTKTASRRRANGGEALSYTLTVRNLGPSDARAVVLSDPVPADVVVLSTTPSTPTCTINGQLISCAFGTLRPGEIRSVTIDGRAAGAPPPPRTPSHGDHLITVSKAESSIALNAGDTRPFDVSCGPGAIATDGSGRVESVDQGTGDLASVKVLEARATSLGTYRFVLHNDATGRAQLHLYVTCLSGTTTGGDGPAHPLVTETPVTATATLAVGARQTITLPLALDHIAIAPSYAVQSGVARLVASEPTTDGLQLTFEVTQPAVVTASMTPLLARLGEVAGHSHELIFHHIEDTVTVPAHGTVTKTLSCAQDAKGIVASFDGPSVGNEPQPKSRVFRLFNPGPQAVTAMVDLECVEDRTGPVERYRGVVTNVATATSTTADPVPANDSAFAQFVVHRAVADPLP
jgi:uncharacterized repeat protein (TIGR01451 family)